MCRRIGAAHAYAPIATDAPPTDNEVRSRQLRDQRNDLLFWLFADLMTCMMGLYVLNLSVHGIFTSCTLQADYALTQTYTTAMCSPSPTLVAHDEQTTFNMEAAHAQLATEFFFLSSPNITRTVHLYYPPLRHWRMYRASIRSVNEWIESMANNPS